MGTYAARRLIWLPFLLLIVTFVTFALLRVGPGDPVQVWLGQHQNDEVRERLRAQLGLDDPLVVQYVRYVEGVVTRLDFGDSFQLSGQARFGTSLKTNAGLAATERGGSHHYAGGRDTRWACSLGLKQGTGLDVVAVTIALVFQSLPVFITAPVLLLLFALKLDLLPASGWEGFFSPNIVMPALVMGVPGIAIVVRFVRASVLDVMAQDYIRTARAKGLSESTVQWRHILRNAMLPLWTIFGFTLAGLAGGTFIVEIYFGIPGVGLFAIESFFQRDYPVLLAIATITTAIFVLANLIIDVTYSLLDPRIRVGGGNVT